MLGGPPVVEGRVAAAFGTSAGGPPSTGRWLIHDGADCAICDAPRPLLAVKHGDAFCSTKCARAWYGCPLDPASERQPPKAKLAA